VEKIRSNHCTNLILKKFSTGLWKCIETETVKNTRYELQLYGSVQAQFIDNNSKKIPEI
jgi:hypothetical protein